MSSYNPIVSFDEILGNAERTYLCVVVLDADEGQNLVEIVRGKAVAGPLGEEGNGDDDAHTSPVARGGDERLPTDIRGDLTVEGEGGLDLLEFVFHERIFPKSNASAVSQMIEGRRDSLVSICMVVCQRVQCLLVFALADQPPRALRHEKDEEDLKD